MTSASALVDTAALMLLQNLREGMETGRIANVNTAQTEVEAAITELNRRQLLEEPTHINDLLGKLLLEIGSLHEKVARCESQLTEFQFQVKALKEDTTQIVARTEACNVLVEQQQKENAKVLAAMEGVKAGVTTTTPPSVVPAPSPTDLISRPTSSMFAIVSFPGGPRTVTIHPPGSPSYQSIIRDEKGDVIIDFRRTKPLRREGAFRGSLEDLDWLEITRVYGRGPDPPGTRTVPSVPRWPDRTQPSSCPPPSRSSSDLIARQHQLSTSVQTDPFGRVLAPEYPNAEPAPLSTDVASSSSSHASSQVSRSSLSAKPDIVSTVSSSPPSPSLGRGKKRTRESEEDGEVSLTTEAREEGSLLMDLRTIKEPTTPTPVKREESHPPEGPAKRKKRRSSTSLASEAPERTHSLLDLARTG